MYELLKNLIQEISFFKITQLLLKGFLLVFPFQIRTLFLHGDFYLSGNFNNYNSFFIYAGDIILIAALVFWGLAFVFKEISGKIELGDFWLTVLLLFFWVYLIFNIFTINNDHFSFFIVYRYMLLFALYFLLINNIISKDKIIEYFLAGMIFQVAIGLVQYIKQASAGLVFLGEPEINAGLEGVAKIDLNQMKIVRIYGTFLHPNILASAIYFSLMLVFARYKKNIPIFAFLTLVFCLGLVLTFSRSAFLALLISLFIFFSISEKRDNYKNLIFIVCSIIFFIVVFDFQNIFWSRFILGIDGTSTAERLNYMSISKQMLGEYPFGVGLGNFTMLMQNFSSIKLFPWEMQPVHNTFMLIINEIGITGGLIFGSIFFYLFFRIIYLINMIKSNYEARSNAYTLVSLLCGIIVLACFDHYFFTSYQAQVILFIYFALVGNLLKKFPLPLKKS